MHFLAPASRVLLPRDPLVIRCRRLAHRHLIPHYSTCAGYPAELSFALSLFPFSPPVTGPALPDTEVITCPLFAQLIYVSIRRRDATMPATTHTRFYCLSSSVPLSIFQLFMCRHIHSIVMEASRFPAFPCTRLCLLIDFKFDALLLPAATRFTFSSAVCCPEPPRKYWPAVTVRPASESTPSPSSQRLGEFLPPLPRLVPESSLLSFHSLRICAETKPNSFPASSFTPPSRSLSFVFAIRCSLVAALPFFRCCVTHWYSLMLRCEFHFPSDFQGRPFEWISDTSSWTVCLVIPIAVHHCITLPCTLARGGSGVPLFPFCYLLLCNA